MRKYLLQIVPLCRYYNFTEGRGAGHAFRVKPRFKMPSVIVLSAKSIPFNES